MGRSPDRRMYDESALSALVGARPDRDRERLRGRRGWLSDGPHRPVGGPPTRGPGPGRPRPGGPRRRGGFGIVVYGSGPPPVRVGSGVPGRREGGFAARRTGGAREGGAAAVPARPGGL